MKIKSIEKYNLPEFWACYLINGDSSGMNDDDIKQCDEYTKDLGNCTEVSEDSHFGRFKGIGHTLAEFTFVIWE